MDLSANFSLKFHLRQDFVQPFLIRGKASLLSLKFYVLLALSSQLSVFLKLCIMNSLPFCIFCCVSHAAVSGMYPWVARISPS